MNQYLDIRDGTHDTPKYVKNGFPLVTSKNLDNGKIDFTSAKSIGEEDHINISKRSKVDDNDILFAMIGTIGNPVLVSKDREFSIKNVALFKPFIKETYMEYIFYYLLYVQNQMQKNASGAVQSFVSLTVLRNYYISIPPLNEQKRIVKKIEELLPLIEDYDIFENELNKLNEEFPNKIKDSILQEAIQGKLVPQDSDDEPSSVLLERIKKEKEQLIKDKKIKRNKNESFIFKENNHFYEKIGNKEPICIDEEIPFDIPYHWQWCRMEYIIQLISGRDMKSNEYNDNEKGIPYITGASNIENNNLIINRWIENPGVISIKNDILLTCKGTIGKLLVLNEPKVHIARQIMAIRIFDENLIFRDFVLLVLEYYVNKLQNIAKSMIPGVSRDDVLKILVPLPPFKEQKRIVKKKDEINKLILKYCFS